MTELLTGLSIIFIIAGPILFLAKQTQLSAVPALIIAGLIAGLFIDENLKIELARLGIALLVFTFSVKIHTETVRTVVTDSEVVAITQAAIVGAIGIGVGVVLGVTPEQAIYLGIAAALSSTIVGTTLFQPIRRDIVHDHLSASIHSVQDLLAILILLILGAGTFAVDSIATQLGYGVMLLVAAVVVNRYLFGSMARLAKGSSESMLVGIIALLIIFLALAELAEISIVVGAFAAGVAVRDDPVNYSNVLNGLESIKDFFAAIFFVTVGALVAVSTVDVLVFATVLVVLTALIKPAIIIVLLVYKGYDRRSATLTAFDLDHVGEFGIIVAIEAFVLGILVTSVFEAIILAAAVSMVLSSFTHYYDEQLYRTLVNRGWLGQPYHKAEDWKNVPHDISDHFVIVGYGRHGRQLVSFCERVDQPYVVIEDNPELFDDLRTDCDAYVFGDAIEQESCQVSNLEEARLVISTVSSKAVNDHLLSFTDTVDVIVRTDDVTVANDLIEQGAIYVIVPDLLAADLLADNLEALINGEYDSEHLRVQSMEDLDDASTPSRPASTGSVDTL